MKDMFRKVAQEVRNIPGWWNFDNKIEEALTEWVQSYPDPEKIVLTDGQRNYTPGQIAKEVAARTEFGVSLIRMTRELAREFPEMGPSGIIDFIIGIPQEEE